MTSVARLVTLVDVRDTDDASSMSVSARHEAVLGDGRRVLLLDGRGWTSSRIRMRAEGIPGDDSSPGDTSDIWAATRVEDIESSARQVVGPDEAFAGYTQEEMETGHWAFLCDVLRNEGILADADTLKQLPHDVILSERLLARIGRGGDGPST